MRIAVIGGGVAGLAAAWFLQSDHQVTLFEKEDYVGGHAHAIPVTVNGTTVYVETAFKYFADTFYPYLMALLRELHIPLRWCRFTCTFVRRDGVLVTPPRAPRHVLDLLRSPRKIQQLVSLFRFMRASAALVDKRDWSQMLKDYVRELGYSEDFANEVLYPLVAGSWGAPLKEIPDFPAYSLLKVVWQRSTKGKMPGFFEFDGEGGSSNYINRLVRELGRVELRLGAGVRSLSREASGIRVENERGESEVFDRVVLATPACDAARLLATMPEARAWYELVGQFRHFETKIAIHSDPTFMPKRRSDWSIINYFHEDQHAWITEWSGWRQKVPVFRTWLPPHRPLPQQIHHRKQFFHIVDTTESPALQRQIAALQGAQGIWAVGLYVTDVNSHESALASAVHMARTWAPNSPNLTRLERAVADVSAKA